MRSLVADGYARLQAVLGRLPQESWESAGGVDGWSPKEQLGHVTFWESTLLWRAGRGEEMEYPEDLLFGETDSVNGRVRDWLRPQSADEVRARADRIHAAVLDLLAGVDDQKMDQPFVGEENDPRPIWRLVAGETWAHYPEHVEMLERALLSP